MIRILAHYDEKTGSHYHRVHVPCENIKRNSNDFEIIAKKNLSENDFANCDILFYNRFIKLDMAVLNALRNKYGFKIVIDMDDKIHIPKDHYMYGFYEKEKIPAKIESNLINADYIICSTNYLADDLKKYNKNIIVIPNAIDFNVDQFQYKDRDDSDKLRIVYPCSLSHVHDVKLLETSFKKIKSDTFTHNNTIFTLAGYNETNQQTKNIWKKMTDVYKTLGKYNIANSIPTDGYMQHYDNQDICIIPLRTTEFEKSKSNLKLLEAGAKKCAVIASDVIPYIFDEGYYLPVKTTTDWYKHIKDFKKNKNMLIHYQEKLYEYVKTKFNMDIVNNDRIELFKYLKNDYKYEQKLTKIISITYDDNQPSEYEKYRNPIKTVDEKSYLFEYNPIINILNNNIYDVNNYKYTGIFSWKFSLKSRISERELYRAIDDEHDVYIFVYPHFNNGKDYFDFSEKVHNGLLSLLSLLCKRLNLEYTDSPEHVVYSNFVIINTQLYKTFINDIIIPAIILLETEFKELAWKNSKYPGLPAEKLKYYTGLDYYPMHTFVLERLMSIYLHNHKYIKVKNCIGKN